MTESTRLFTLRLWPAAETGAPDAPQWRGKIQSLPDGEAYYFRDWLDLIQALETMLSTKSEEIKYSVTKEFLSADLADSADSREEIG